MTDFNVGDKIEIIYHTNAVYKGKHGKVMFVGHSLKAATNPLSEDFGIPDETPRLIVALDDGTIVNDIRDVQLKKI
jgi:hypothetical protein